MRLILILIALLLLSVDSLAKNNEEGIHRESLISESREYERLHEAASAFLDDTAVTAYVNKVLRSLGGKDPKIATYRVRIRKSPDFNAFAIPHGSIYVNTGMLALAENEAQLAALLGHELVHILNDHAARDLVKAKKSALSSAHLRIGLDFFVGSLAGSISGVALRSAITGYSRDLEREADSLGLVLMMKAGYAPMEFRNLFLLMKARIERDKIREPFFFSTHPAVSERISNYYALAGKDTARSAEGRKNAEAFTRIVSPVLVYDGISNYAAGKFDVAERNFSRVLEIDSCNGRALLYLGACKLLKGPPQSNRDVVELYGKAAACDPSFHDALRELGFWYFKSGDMDSASYYFKKYKAASPRSPDMPMIEDYLKQCDR